jgi:DNA-directed RNA polymerase subunit beta
LAINKISERINFASITPVIDYPDFLDVQLQSFRDFFQLETAAENRTDEGLFKVFAENFPISDSRENFVLEFIDYHVDPPKYSVDECIDRGLTYSVPLKAKLRLICNDDDNEDFETIEQEVFLGNIPYMTEKGSFVINGLKGLLYRNYTAHQEYSLLKVNIPMVLNYILPGLYLLKVPG